MTAKSHRIGHPRARRRALAACLIGLGIAATQPAHAAEPMNIVLDQATILKLPEGTTTVIVGNPLIADVSVQAGGLTVVTGKGYGATNLIVLDRAGATLMERELQVRGNGENTVVVYRGGERESYNCAPTCERRITLGDSPAFFAATASQTNLLNAQATGAAKPPGR